MLNIVSPSEQIKTTAFAHGAATVSKTPLVIGGRVLIPLNTNATGEHNAFVFEAIIEGAPKAAVEAWAVNQALYWSAANGNFTTTATGNTLCGYALEAAASADTVGGRQFFNTFA